MKKFRFTDEFETGLIIKNNVLILDGKKVEVKCPILLGDIGIEGVPCLVRTDSGKKITVVAVSHGVSDTGRRNWICVRPMLYEDAFGFFLEQYMRGKVIREYHVIKRCSDSGQIKCDYIVDDTVAIEIKTLVPPISAHKGNIQAKLSVCPSDCFNKCFDHLTAVKDFVKRKILLIICPYGAKGEVLDYCGEEILKSAKEKKVEIWLVEMFVDADDIELMSYQNVEECHAQIFKKL